METRVMPGYIGVSPQKVQNPATHLIINVSILVEATGNGIAEEGGAGA